jgi:hypothetical protein
MNSSEAGTVSGWDSLLADLDQVLQVRTISLDGLKTSDVRD